MSSAQTPTPTAPVAPARLPESGKKAWTAAYVKALAQAKTNFPEDERRQRAEAAKAANAMLAVPEPKSADDINALEDWQVLVRGTRNGKTYCVTSDGRKYSFDAPAPAPQKPVDAPKK
jgi:hypothetical protein